MTGSPEARVRALVNGARRLSDPSDPLGREARAVLPGATRLSPEGVALVLEDVLEARPADAEIAALCASVAPVPRAWVVPSANVFMAAHRAVALALAASDEVRVVPSRRAPHFAGLLARAAPGLFHIESRLAPSPGDHVWAYGRKEALAAIGGAVPEGTVVHAHGPGLGVIVLDLDAAEATELEALGRAAASDVIPFDQRGCLSPRLVIARGPVSRVRRLAEELARALADAEARIPRGVLDPEEAAEAVRYRDTMRVAAELLPAGPGWVGLDVAGSALVVPPVGRHLHVVRTEDLVRAITPLHGAVTTMGVFGDDALRARLSAAFPGARSAPIGRMQRPPFDGPVDLRPATDRAPPAAVFW